MNKINVGSIGENSLNTIRIIAALQVFMGHMIAHLNLTLPYDVLEYPIYYFIGVPIFFALSGFLIWFSIEKSKSYVDYLKKRFWRIYPELWIAVLVEVAVMVALYHKRGGIDLLMFIIGQATIFQFWTPNSLRGYGTGTPNGALWTICVTIQFYMVIWFIHKILKGRSKVFWIAGFIVSLLVSVGLQWLLSDFIGKEIVSKLYDQTFVKYFWLFYIGMAVAEFQKDIIPILKKYWWIFIVISAVFYITRIDINIGYYILHNLFMIPGLLGFAFRFPKLNIRPDISYGIFLYHMTVVNVFITFGLTDSWLYAAMCTLISCALALISTKTVGSWSAKKKSMINSSYSQHQQ